MFYKAVMQQYFNKILELAGTDNISNIRNSDDDLW